MPLRYFLGVTHIRNKAIGRNFKTNNRLEKTISIQGFKKGIDAQLDLLLGKGRVLFIDRFQTFIVFAQQDESDQIAFDHDLRRRYFG